MDSTSQTLYMPIASPPTPVPSPGPSLSSHSLMNNLCNPTIRRQYLTSILNTCSPAELLFISTTIAPLLKRDFLRDLPTELGLYVVSWIDEPRTLLRAMRVSKCWEALMKDESVWRRMCHIWDFGMIGDNEPFIDRDHVFDEEDLVASEWLTKGRKRKLKVKTAINHSRTPISSYIHFKRSYLTMMNWRHGGHLLRSHRVPASTPLQSQRAIEQTQHSVITSMALSPHYLVVGLASNNILVFSTKTGVLVRTLVGHELGVWGVWLVNAGGRMFRSSSNPTGTRTGPSNNLPDSLKHALGIIGPNSNSRTPPPPPYNESFEEEDEEQCVKLANSTSVGFGQPNDLVVSGGCDKVVKVWDLRSGYCIYTLTGHSSTIRTLLVLPNSSTCVSGSRDGTLRVWDIQLGIALRTLRGHDGSVRCLDYWGRKVVSGSYDSTCRIWDVDTGECLHVLRGHLHQIYSVAFDGTRIASGGLDTTVRIWDAHTGICLALLQGHSALVCQLQFSPGFPPLTRPSIPSSSQTSQTSPRSGSTSSSPLSQKPHHHHQIQHTGALLATADSSGNIILFSLSTFNPIYKLAAHTFSVTSLQFDSEWLVSGGNDGKVRIWEARTGNWVRDLGEGGEGVWKVGFVSADERRLYGGTLSAEGAIKVGFGGGGEEGVVAVMCKRGSKSVMEIWSMAPREDEL